MPRAQVEFSQLHLADSGHAAPSVPAGEQLLLQDVCLLLGTSVGYVQLHAEDGQLLHRQRLHTTSAQTVSARVTGMGKDSALHCVSQVDLPHYRLRIITLKFSSDCC